MNPATLLQPYLDKYHLTLDHPAHGRVDLTSPDWPTHPDLQTTVQHALARLAGVSQVTSDGPGHLTVRYDSTVLRRLNPLTLLAVERRISQAYRRAGL